MAEQAPSDEPDLEAFIARAVEDCDRAALETTLRDDPLRLPYIALASFLRAQWRLHKDSRQPISDGAIRQGVASGLTRHGFAITKELVKRNLILSAGMLAAALLVGGGIGYWIKPGGQAVVGVAAGAQQCADQADGSRLCWIPVWTKLPPGR